jgi:hypothetical protein
MEFRLPACAAPVQSRPPPPDGRQTLSAGCPGCGRASVAAADVSGLGGILYAMLTGGPPFAEDDVLETMIQVHERPPLLDLEKTRDSNGRCAGLNDLTNDKDLRRFLQPGP